MAPQRNDKGRCRHSEELTSILVWLSPLNGGYKKKAPSSSHHVPQAPNASIGSGDINDCTEHEAVGNQDGTITLPIRSIKVYGYTATVRTSLRYEKSGRCSGLGVQLFCMVLQAIQAFKKFQEVHPNLHDSECLLSPRVGHEIYCGPVARL